MAKIIRQIGLKIIVSLLSLVVRPAPAGWQRSKRPASLDGR
jgi:hypothetical protein